MASTTPFVQLFQLYIDDIGAHLNEEVARENAGAPLIVVTGIRLKHCVGTQDRTARRRRSAAVTRDIRLLRAHGLVHKRPKSHRYMVTPKGHRILSALLAAYQANAESLTKLAA